MRRRIGRPGLVGTMARTAAIAGTATAVSGGVARRQSARAQSNADEQAAAQAQDVQMAEMQSQLAQLESQQQAPPPASAAAASPAGGDDMLAQLEKLGEMHKAGVLDDAEFATAKAKLLGG
jgi:hypothetical protein